MLAKAAEVYLGETGLYLAGAKTECQIEIKHFVTTRMGTASSCSVILPFGHSTLPLLISSKAICVFSNRLSSYSRATAHKFPLDAEHAALLRTIANKKIKRTRWWE